MAPGSRPGSSRGRPRIARSAAAVAAAAALLLLIGCSSGASAARHAAAGAAAQAQAWGARCKNPLGKANYKIGDGPKQGGHGKLSLDKWQITNAIDFTAAAGTPVYAITDGTVCAPPECAFGVDPKDPDSLEQLTLTTPSGQAYHYSNMVKLQVKAGQRVPRAQVLGSIGSGKEGTHLHLATRLGSPCDILEACVPMDHRGC